MRALLPRGRQLAVGHPFSASPACLSDRRFSFSTSALVICCVSRLVLHTKMRVASIVLVTALGARAFVSAQGPSDAPSGLRQAGHQP